MKILFLDTYYPKFLESVKSTVLQGNSDYQTILDKLLALRFGTADFYSRNLNKLGHETRDIIFNFEELQRQWIFQTRKQPLVSGNLIRRIIQKLPFPLITSTANANSLDSIAINQIKDYQPDILYLQDLNILSPQILNELRATRVVKLIVGQIACPLPSAEICKAFDLILTSFPHYVDRFRAQGIASEYFKIAFDPIVLNDIGQMEKTHTCTFVGGISPAHTERLAVLEKLAKNTDIQFYGYGKDDLKKSSPIIDKHLGEVWGLDMYRALAQSRITVNIHIDVAENNANNMRLFEATGCGALLLTDMKDNLFELFKIDEEIITYRNSDEAVEKIHYYSARPEEARAIAIAGQRRTLSEHTYFNRMSELSEILERHLHKLKSR
jgi:hypothetical protein